MFSETWHSAVAKMAWAVIVFFIFKSNPSIIDGLSGFGTLWGQLLSVTTFTLTFFLNQSYALWRKCYALSRRLQGRLNDLGMTLAAHAARKTPASPTEPSTYTAASRQMLELVSRYIRLFNVLTYASFTRSHRPILTPRGMRRLVERGLLTAQERQVLVDAEIPATQRHNSLILWIMRIFIEARQAGHVVGGAGFENQFMEKIHVIRAQYGAIGDELQGRMPLAYAHIVQVLVDVVLWMYPIMSFSTGMSPFIGVLGSGLLTMFYQGLFDLAKQFLDPYDNENYGKGDDPLCVDTLVAETNSGSVRWMYGFEEQPFSSQRLRDGELFEYLLPVRGYSVEELAEMEEERQLKEKELQEKREREEAERIKREKEEEEERLKLEEEALLAHPSNETLSNVTETLIETTNVSIDKGSESAQKAIQTKGVDAAAERKDQKVLHKVYTLPDGTPVTLKEPGEGDIVEDILNMTRLDVLAVNGDLPVAPVNQTLNMTATTEATLVEEDDEPFTLIDFEMYQDLEWYDEVGEDGKEYRLSEQLADEIWEEEKETEDSAPLTYEEYTERAAEIIEAAQSELLETAEILKASPGAETALAEKSSGTGVARGPVEPLKRLDRKEKSGSPKYDQTRLDGISQLWGLPPEDPSAFEGYPEPVSLDKDEYRFEGISQLWGETPTPPDASADTTILGDGGNFGGISQLWGDEPLVGMSGDSNPKKRARVGGEGGGSSSVPFNIDTSIYSELEWFDEVGPDGQEYRLSQMLADEVWDDDEPDENAEPISFAEFAKKVEDIREAARDEILETEAILQAPPGADSWDDPHYDRRQKEKAETPANETDVDVSLDALEMDNNSEKSAGDPGSNAKEGSTYKAVAAESGVVEAPTDEEKVASELNADPDEHDDSSGDDSERVNGGEGDPDVGGEGEEGEEGDFDTTREQ